MRFKVDYLIFSLTVTVRLKFSLERYETFERVEGIFARNGRKPFTSRTGVKTNLYGVFNGQCYLISLRVLPSAKMNAYFFRYMMIILFSIEYDGSLRYHHGSINPKTFLTNRVRNSTVHDNRATSLNYMPPNFPLHDTMFVPPADVQCSRIFVDHVLFDFHA